MKLIKEDINNDNKINYKGYTITYDMQELIKDINRTLSNDIELTPSIVFEIWKDNDQLFRTTDLLKAKHIIDSKLS